MRSNAIQFLRAAAAILVVYAHSIDLQMRFSTSRQQNYYYLQNFGAFGVDIFFVISGFVISLSASRYMGAKDGKQFLVRRFIRVNPVYYLASILWLLILLYPHPKAELLFLDLHQLVKSVFLLPILDKTTWIRSFLDVAWTLSFEWLFYLLFCIGILFRIRNKTLFLGLLIAVLVIAGAIGKSADIRMIFITNPIMLEFLLGVLLYRCYSRWSPSGTLAAGILLLGIAACLYEILSGYGDISEAMHTINGTLSFLRFFYWGIPAALLVAGCIFLEKRGKLDRLWNNRFIALAGNASYSIYLTHVVVYGLFAAFYMRVGFFLNPDLAIIVQLLLAILGGLIFYKMVETPLLRLLRKAITSSAKSPAH